MPSQSLSSAKAGYEGTTFDHLLSDCSSCGLITIDREGNITSLNPEAQRVLQLPPLQTPSAAAKTLPLPIATLVREVFHTGKAAANRKITFDSHQKTPITLSVTAMPVSGQLGFSVVAMLNDNSVTTRLEHNLRRLDRLARVGILSAGLAHEIKNALVSVKTFVDLLLEKNQNAELSETVQREIARMDGLVTHMLRFAAPPHPTLARVHVHLILEHALQMIQPRLGAKLISVCLNFRASDDVITGDASQLEQVFLNLLLNALDALGEEGALNVSTELVDTPNGPRVSIQIADTGRGISAEDLPQIFEPFFTTKPRGTGLGLAVTRGIIQEHKGDVHVESHLGKGTVFTVRLPVGAAAER